MLVPVVVLRLSISKLMSNSGGISGVAQLPSTVDTEAHEGIVVAVEAPAGDCC